MEVLLWNAGRKSTSNQLEIETNGAVVSDFQAKLKVELEFWFKNGFWENVSQTI